MGGENSQSESESELERTTNKLFRLKELGKRVGEWALDSPVKTGLASSIPCFGFRILNIFKEETELIEQLAGQTFKQLMQYDNKHFHIFLNEIRESTLEAFLFGFGVYALINGVKYFSSKNRGSLIKSVENEFDRLGDVISQRYKTFGIAQGMITLIGNMHAIYPHVKVEYAKLLSWIPPNRNYADSFVKHVFLNYGVNMVAAYLLKIYMDIIKKPRLRNSLILLKYLFFDNFIASFYSLIGKAEKVAEYKLKVEIVFNEDVLKGTKYSIGRALFLSGKYEEGLSQMRGSIQLPIKDYINLGYEDNVLRFITKVTYHMAFNWAVITNNAKLFFNRDHAMAKFDLAFLYFIYRRSDSYYKKWNDILSSDTPNKFWLRGIYAEQLDLIQDRQRSDDQWNLFIEEVLSEPGLIFKQLKDKRSAFEVLVLPKSKYSEQLFVLKRDIERDKLESEYVLEYLFNQTLFDYAIEHKLPHEFNTTARPLMFMQRDQDGKFYVVLRREDAESIDELSDDDALPLVETVLKNSAKLMALTTRKLADNGHNVVIETPIKRYELEPATYNPEEELRRRLISRLGENEYSESLAALVLEGMKKENGDNAYPDVVLHRDFYDTNVLDNGVIIDPRYTTRKNGNGTFYVVVGDPAVDWGRFLSNPRYAKVDIEQQMNTLLQYASGEYGLKLEEELALQSLLRNIAFNQACFTGYFLTEGRTEEAQSMFQLAKDNLRQGFGDRTSGKFTDYVMKASDVLRD